MLSFSLIFLSKTIEKFNESLKVVSSIYCKFTPYIDNSKSSSFVFTITFNLSASASFKSYNDVVRGSFTSHTCPDVITKDRKEKDYTLIDMNIPQEKKKHLCEYF